MKTLIIRNTLILLFMVFSSTVLMAQETSLLGGFARINITPDKRVTLSGYANRKDLSTGIHDSLSARVAAFQSKSDKIILVSTDVIGFYSGTDEIIRDAILKQFNLQPQQLFLAAIHTHAGPSIILDKKRGHANNVEYTQTLQQKLITAIGQALDNLQPISVGAGNGSSPVGVNRREVYYDEAGNPRLWIGRNPDGVHDKQVSVLKITAHDDKLLAVLWEYATHSTSLGWENYTISGDVHGLAEQFIERYLGAGVFAPGFAGASGDIDPWYRVLPGFETKNGWVPEPVLLGTMLGEEVVHVLRKIEATSPSGPIRSIYKTIELPGKPGGEIKTTMDHPKVPLNITVGRLGDVAFVGLGAEVLSDIGLAIKAASPFKHTFIITHCNGTADYIAPQHLYVEGGYEVESSPFASTAADMLAKEVVQLLHKL
ncbi:neutral/alkaline non-lysosomal ceramidase N-terminal domain-containing protein [candidate division KSB1 bacterium]|nr:neutral/alkaline non-lysosomal ceramidase N-terminal domain-containing protein [candidate division KSB1 bacterium]